MKEKLIKTFGFKFSERTKHNEIWKSEFYVMIWNKAIGTAKIKPL